MSDDLERLLGQLRPRGAAGELRPRVLDAVNHELAPLKRTPTMFKNKLVYAAITLFILFGIVLTADGGWMIASGGRLEAKLKAVRDAGDPVTLPDLAHPATKGLLRNAAEPLGDARKDIHAMLPQLYAVMEGDDYKTGKLTDEDRKKLKDLFDANAAVLKLLEKAGDYGMYRPKIDYNAKPDEVTAAVAGDAPDFRAVINLLQVRSRLQLAEGQRREALQTCLLMFRLARLSDGSLFLINHLVTCALRAVAVECTNRVLRSGPVADADHDALEAELARHDGHEGFIKALKNERALGVSSYDAMKNLLNAGFMNDDECFYLDLVQEQIDLAPKPYAEFLKAVKTFQATAGITTPLANQVFPALQKVREAHERTRGLVRCLRVFNALQKAGIKPADGEPKLSDLKLAAAATIDPFTDKPLGVKIVDGQFVIYTVGPDLVDDGGDLANHKDFGVGPLAVEEKK
jgi:hypothetical protein